MRSRAPVNENGAVRGNEPQLYVIHLRGHLGATSLGAFPEMVSEQRGSDCFLTGLVPDRSALFGVLAQIEALGLELIEIRRLVPNAEPSPKKE
jgi:hypothetical protein